MPKITLKLAFPLLALFALLGTVVLASRMSASQPATAWSLPLSGLVFAMDAGHGGADGGAVSADGLIEKTISLPIALYLRDYLQEAGALVIMTREKDVDLARAGTKGYYKRKVQDLQERVRVVNESGADYLVSIHLNSIPSPRWYGAQTFYKADSGEAKALAEAIQREIARQLENTTRVAKPVQDVYLIRQASLPAVLVEVGFLSHPDEAQRLGNPVYQKKMAAAIYHGILSFIEETEAVEKSYPIGE